ncbi:hypothetical protein ACHQM5_020547 [Ranunculus cassubicifolius]
MDQQCLTLLDFPEDIVHQIAHKIVSFKQYIQFGAVCKLWQSYYIQGVERHLLRRQPQFPLLLLPSQINQHSQTRCLFDIVEKRNCDIQVLLPCPGKCIGSSNGWLAVICENHDVYLFNPFLSSPHNQIQLPSLKSCRYDDLDFVDDLHRVIFSDNPTVNSTNLVIFGIYSISLYLVMCKPGDQVWTWIDRTQYKVIHGGLYYGERFYFIDHFGALFTSDRIDPQPKTNPPVLSQILSIVESDDTKYLVEVSGELLLIRRYIDLTEIEPSVYRTVRFRVFKLNLDERKVTEVKSLNNYAVFLGLNTPFSVPASEFLGCKPNCIYFTDDYFEGFSAVEEGGSGPQDFGVYSLDDGSIEPYYPMESNMINPAPIWVEPTLKPLY